MNVVQNNNTLLNITNDTNQANFNQKRSRVGKTELGQDAFLQLLTAQLKYQDPLNPLDNSQFISQQAQFTQIEKTDKLISAINNSNLISQSSSLVGKYAEFLNEDGQKSIGRIDSVQIGTNSLGLQVGENTYSLNQITQLYADPPQS